LPYFHSEHVSSTSSDIVYDVIRCVWDKDNSGKCGTFHSHDFFSINFSTISHGLTIIIIIL